LRQTQYAKEFVNSLISMNKVKIMQSSLIVKVVDGQRERHFDKGIEVIPPRTKFIPKD